MKNERMEVKLVALCLNDGKTETFTDGISTNVEECNLWSAVKMIVADTTSVNTGKTNGVVVRLKRIFSKKVFDKQLFFLASITCLIGFCVW